MQKPSPRWFKIMISVTPQERDRLLRLAKRRGLRLSTLVRTVALEAEAITVAR